MKLNDKLKAEMRTLINEPPYERIVPYYLVNSKRLDDIIDQTITSTIKHCAEVVGKEIYKKCYDCGKHVPIGHTVPTDEYGNCVAGGTHHHLENLTNPKEALKQAQQRLLDLI